jgi:hypothetical protein
MVAAIVGMTMAVGVGTATLATAPSSGTLSAPGDAVTWSGASPADQVGYECTGPGDPQCETFGLTLAPTAPVVLTIELRADVPVEDWDLRLFGPDGAEIDGELRDVSGVVAIPSHSSPGSVLETVTVNNPAAGTYQVVAQPYQATAGSGFEATASLAEYESGVPVAPASTATAPQYVNYAAPDGLAVSAGEPSIGWTGPAKDAVMFQASTETTEVHWDDTYTTPIATWTPRPSPLNSSATTFDPILATDPVLGRTMVSQLLLACSGASFSDDAGVSWSPSTGCPAPNGTDHQSVGFGPARPGSVESMVAPQGRMAYYCSQDVVTAFCGASVDGGQTFGVGRPVFTALDGCTAFHGHVKVGPDGTVYVPNERCGGQAVGRSVDNGQTWTTARIPGFTGIANLTHPSMAVSNAGPNGPTHGGGVVYYANTDGEDRMLVTVSEDRGTTWRAPIRLAPGLKSIDFPVVVAGDPDRAAVAFFGTTDGAAGDYSDVGYGEVDGHHTVAWQLYVAHTYDRGKTWTTTSVTGADPTQRGCLWTRGTTTDAAEDACRNLLDFIGITMDGQGRALVGWADGCTGACVASDLVADDARSKLGTISRQTTGLPLLSAFDGKIGLGKKRPPRATGCVTSDPAGDGAFFGSANASLDLVGAAISMPSKTVYRFEMPVVDLTKSSPNGGEYTWTFRLGGHDYELVAIGPALEGSSFTLAVDGAAAKAVTGAFDTASSAVRVDVPTSLLPFGAGGASIVTSSALETRAHTVKVLAPLYDNAVACDIDLAALSSPRGGRK